MYYVLEIQKGNETAPMLKTEHEDINTAEQKYHTVLAAAAVSTVPAHTAVLMDDTGETLRRQTYYH